MNTHKVSPEFFSAVAFILKNQIKNENGTPMEFRDHSFLIDPFDDNTPRQVIKKCSQIGWSTLAILRSFHLAKYAGANIIHTFPSRNMTKEFVVPKVNPLIENNKAIKDMITYDSLNIKKIGNRFIYYRGSYEVTEAISISAHILINDEFDRCLKIGTEVLTKNGWKEIQNITKEDYVLTRHPENHLSSFKKPTAIIKQNYRGEFYTLKGRGINISATKNHKFLVQFEGKKQSLETISKIWDKPFSVINKCRWGNGYRQSISVPQVYTKRNVKGKREVKPLIFPAKKVNKEAWFEFLGWYLSEGCIAKSKNYRGNKRANGQIVITQKNKKNINLIVDCIKRLGFNPKLYQYNDSATQISFSDLQIALYLQKLGNAYQKHIPKRWLWAHPKLCEEMLKSLMAGDGDERGVYTTISKRLADDVQILILRTGKGASIYKSGDMYKVGIVKTPYRRFNGRMGSNSKAFVEKSHFEGEVFCIEVSNHTMLIRQKGGGLPIWSGNSNQKVLRTYQTRLDDAKRERPELGWEWQFSNPSIPSYGVDVWWQRSDQKHWFVKCRHCGNDDYLRFPDNINFETKMKVCAKCGGNFSPDDLIDGRWVAKYPKREISGYWMSQMFVSWISAEKIIEDSLGDKEVFHNFTLGEPYISKDTSLTREAIIKCLSPSDNPKTDVAIGVDNGVVKHFVIGNRFGIFRIGKTESWQEIEELRNLYDATMVIDALPYPVTPANLADEYAGKVFVHYYQQDKKNIGIIRWDGQIVKSDRTKMIDSVVAEINAKDLLYNLTQYDMEEYITHCLNIFRMVKLSPQGILRPGWQTIEGRPDHFFHATVLYRVALEQTLGQGSIVDTEGQRSTIDRHPFISANSAVPALNLKEVAERASQKKQNWKGI